MFHFVVFIPRDVFADCLSPDSWLLLLMSISSFFGLLLLLSLPLSLPLTPYFVYSIDLIPFTIFLFFWPPFSAWIYHSPLKGEWFLLRSPPLLLAVRHSRRVPPSPSSLSFPFPRSFPPLPRFSPFSSFDLMLRLLRRSYSSSFWLLLFVFLFLDRSYSSLSSLSPSICFLSSCGPQTLVVNFQTPLLTPTLNAEADCLPLVSIWTRRVLIPSLLPLLPPFLRRFREFYIYVYVLKYYIASSYSVSSSDLTN